MFGLLQMGTKLLIQDVVQSRDHGGSHGISCGHRSAYDLLIFEEDQRNYQVVMGHVSRNVVHNGIHTITAISVEDKWKDGTNGTAKIVSGGVGQRSVNIHLESRFNRGMHFLVKIWGAPNTSFYPNEVSMGQLDYTNGSDMSSMQICEVTDFLSSTRNTASETLALNKTSSNRSRSSSSQTLGLDKTSNRSSSSRSPSSQTLSVSKTSNRSRSSSPNTLQVGRIIGGNSSFDKSSSTLQICDRSNCSKISNSSQRSKPTQLMIEAPSRYLVESPPSPNKSKSSRSIYDESAGPYFSGNGDSFFSNSKLGNSTIKESSGCKCRAARTPSPRMIEAPSRLSRTPSPRLSGCPCPRRNDTLLSNTQRSNCSAAVPDYSLFKKGLV